MQLAGLSLPNHGTKPCIAIIAFPQRRTVDCEFTKRCWFTVYLQAFVPFRLALQYFFMRMLTAFRCDADSLRRRERPAVAFSRPASLAMMNDSGSSSSSNESRKSENSAIKYFVSCAMSASRVCAPRLASSYRWASRLGRGIGISACRSGGGTPKYTSVRDGKATTPCLPHKQSAGPVLRD
jgi:hypothetical protein